MIRGRDLRGAAAIGGLGLLALASCSDDDGNGGEYDRNGNDITLWFFSRAEATAPYPPFGAATWEGTINGGTVCNGDARSPGLDPNTGYPITIFGECQRVSGPVEQSEFHRFFELCN